MWLFLIVFLALYALLVFYIGWSGWRWLHGLSRAVKGAYAAVLAFVAVSFILGQFFRSVSLLRIIGAYWMAVLYCLTLLLPLAQLVLWLLKRTKLSRGRLPFWSGWAVLALTALLISVGTYNAYQPTVRSYPIQIQKPAAETAESLTIALAADTHFGLLSDRNHAVRLVEEINALQPDLVLLAGDIVDDSIEPFVQQRIDQVLAGIKAPLGVYAALGNHDKHGGSQEELIAAIERGGIHVLVDEAVTVGGMLTIIGRKDASDPSRADLAALLSGIDRSKPVILIDHQPTELEAAQQQGVDLLVSGHTHHGQVFPGSLFTKMIYEHDYGYLQKEQLHAVVTSGFGFWGPPIRIGTRSEIVRIEVTFGETNEGQETIDRRISAPID